MDFIKITFSITVVLFAIYSFITVKRYSKKINATKDVIENDEQLQKELHRETKKIIVITVVNMALLLIQTLINIIPLLGS